jgi:hypothetical protein
MSVKITTEVIGLQELHKALIDLGSEVAGKGGGLVKNAIRAAARDVKKRQVSGAPQSKKGSAVAPAGRLKRSIRIIRRHPDRINELIVVGPLAGKSRDDPNGAWYASIVEFQGGEGGKGKGFMRKSLKRDKDTNTIRRSLAVNIERVAKKVGNKNAAAVGAKIKRL